MISRFRGSRPEGCRPLEVGLETQPLNSGNNVNATDAIDWCDLHTGQRNQVTRISIPAGDFAISVRPVSSK
jgi:hypothetical protein